jgi:hypothetical protein
MFWVECVLDWPAGGRFLLAARRSQYAETLTCSAVLRLPVVARTRILDDDPELAPHGASVKLPVTVTTVTLTGPRYGADRWCARPRGVYAGREITWTHRESE